LPFDVEAARDAYQQALRIDEPLATASPDDPIAQANLAYSCGRLGALVMSIDDYSEAESQFMRGVSILEALSRATNLADQAVAWPLTADAPALTTEEKAAGPALFQYWLKTQRRKLANCREAQRAIDDLDSALRRPKDRVPELLLIRGRALARVHRHAEAVTTAELLALQDSAKAERWFGAARIYALAAKYMKRDKAEGAIRSGDLATRERYLERAVELLAQAASEHFFDRLENRTLVKIDRDFVLLRDRDDFKQLLAEIAGPERRFAASGQ
jgi:tetratricopeptide (TPR) repeat protein